MFSTFYQATLARYTLILRLMRRTSSVAVEIQGMGTHTQVMYLLPSPICKQFFFLENFYVSRWKAQPDQFVLHPVSMVSL